MRFHVVFVRIDIVSARFDMILLHFHADFALFEPFRRHLGLFERQKRLDSAHKLADIERFREKTVD